MGKLKFWTIESMLESMLVYVTQKCFKYLHAHFYVHGPLTQHPEKLVDAAKGVSDTIMLVLDV